MSSNTPAFNLKLDPTRRRILLVCGVVIVICVAILAIDHYVVDARRPPRAQRLAEVADELGLELRRDRPADDPTEAELIRAVEPFAALVEPADDVGAVMSREAEGYRFWAYEHRYDASVASSRESLQGIEVELLVILFELPGAGLPEFHVTADGDFEVADRDALARVMTPEAARRIEAWEGFGIAAAGDHVVFAPRAPASPLAHAARREQSPEFEPGLLSSGFRVDLQRAIDVVNLMNLDVPRIAGVYGIGTEVELPEPPEPDFGAVDEIVEDSGRRQDELVEELERELEELGTGQALTEEGSP
jgi:hypothetical protein